MELAGVSALGDRRVSGILSNRSANAGLRLGLILNTGAGLLYVSYS